MLKCPCKNCGTRRIGCHGDGKCQKYADYKTEWAKVKTELKDAVDIARRANRYSG